MDNGFRVQDLCQLRAACALGRTFRYVFFPDCGTISDPLTASCLSQWAITPFESQGISFHSAEQAMMHGKALLFGDLDMAENIRASRTPFGAKNLGGKVRGFSESTWIRHRFEVVVEANLPKFATNSVLREFLMSTGESILVEASPTDLVWGNGLDQFDKASIHPDQWPGLNLLGFALMEVRVRLGGATGATADP